MVVAVVVAVVVTVIVAMVVAMVVAMALVTRILAGARIHGERGFCCKVDISQRNLMGPGNCRALFKLWSEGFRVASSPGFFPLNSSPWSFNKNGLPLPNDTFKDGSANPEGRGFVEEDVFQSLRLCGSREGAEDYGGAIFFHLDRSYEDIQSPSGHQSFADVADGFS